jgi:hypothetical protein
MRTNKLIKQKIKSETSAIREIIKAWDPIANSPEDEYDCLVDHIVSALHRGSTHSNDIAALIISEFRAHFGIDEPKSTVTNVATQIVAYWEKNRV